MAEPYCTLLGHLRHEVGHCYRERLVRDGPWLEWFRTMFGDERQDYSACLETHDAEGPPPDWQERFVSGYASAHSWEDFAETWPPYLHIVDTLETAAASLWRRPSWASCASSRPDLPQRRLNAAAVGSQARRRRLNAPNRSDTSWCSAEPSVTELSAHTASITTEVETGCSA